SLPLCVRRVVLRGEVVRLRFAPPANSLRILVALMHVVRNRPELVEELAEEIPAVLSPHHVGANQQIASFLDGLLQQEPFRVPEMDVTEALVGRRSRTVIS